MYPMIGIGMPIFSETEWVEFHHDGSIKIKSQLPTPLGGRISDSVKKLDLAAKLGGLVHGVWVANLLGRPRGGRGWFRPPWFGGVGCSCRLAILILHAL